MSRARLTPMYVFDDAAEYHRRHRSGVEQEFNNESKAIVQFNKRETQFKAWIVAKLHDANGTAHWVFFVRPSDSADYLFPREGETCELTLWNKAGKAKRWEKSWVAERIENPAATFGIPDGPVHRLPAFKVKIPSNVPEDVIRPLEDDPDQVGYDAPSRLTSKHAFSDRKAYRVTLVLRISMATKDAELGALNKLYYNPEDILTVKQKAAFKYLLGFKDVPFTVNLFTHFPHLRDPINNPGGMPTKVITMLKGFNEHQRTAYKALLSTLPCGVGIIPGGPGAGKTHWNLVLTAAIQSKNLICQETGSPSNRSAKVLYILDINKPLDDTCNKIVKLYKSLGLNKYAVRLHGWHYGENKKTPDFSQKFLFIARMSRYRRQTLNEGCLAPSLDELAFNMYEESQATRYRELRDAIGGGRPERLRELVNQLYKDVLERVDFIASTPVPAATAFHGMFKPDIVIFDESPHAREASTMIAIAQYDPLAWMFSGDHRQTRPFVASDDVRDNPWAPQMLVSMMERADRAGAIHHSLLINHRAYGGLQELASEMFYAKKMVTGHNQSELFPPSVQHVQRYLERFLPAGQKCKQPRLIAFSSKRGEERVGTSWFNQSHIDWVMQRVMEILPDTMFRQVGKNERGTILIISPYKESYMKYKRAIKDLPHAWQARLNVEARCEARTIDTCQGGEADFVFLDMVRSESTDFTDDPNRLNVAITRARQGEIIMMHPGMRRSARFLAGIFGYCKSMGQVVDISMDGQLQELTLVPDEEQAYKEHVRYQAQFDQDRVARGLEPIAIDEKPAGTAPVADDVSDEPDADDGPPSMFAEKLANLGLADYMRSIISEKKTDRDVKQSEDQTKLQSKVEVSGQAQGTATHGPALTMGNTSLPPRPREQDQTAQPGNGVSSRADLAADMTALPTGIATGIIEVSNGLSGLGTSRTNDRDAPRLGPNAALLAEAMQEDTEPTQYKVLSHTVANGQGFTALDEGLEQSRWNTWLDGPPKGHRARPAATAVMGHATSELRPTQTASAALLGAAASANSPPGSNGEDEVGVQEDKKGAEALPSGSSWF